jgi:hypothetical protein
MKIHNAAFFVVLLLGPLKIVNLFDPKCKECKQRNWDKETLDRAYPDYPTHRWICNHCLSIREGTARGRRRKPE